MSKLSEFRQKDQGGQAGFSGLKDEQDKKISNERALQSNDYSGKTNSIPILVIQ